MAVTAICGPKSTLNHRAQFRAVRPLAFGLERGLLLRHVWFLLHFVREQMTNLVM